MRFKFWILVSSIGLLTSFLAILYVSFMVFKPIGREGETDIFEYKMNVLDPETNLATVGFVSLPQKLGSEDYISYYIEGTGKYYLISNFGTSGYRCTGSCYCEKYTENVRRVGGGTTTANLIRRVVTLLVASTTTTLAYTVAKNKLEEECRIELSESCTSVKSTIKSEVDKCEMVAESNWRYRRTDGEEDNEEIEDDEDDDDDDDEADYDEEFDKKVEKAIMRPVPGIEAEIEDVEVNEAYDGVRITHERTVNLNEDEEDEAHEREILKYLCHGYCMFSRTYNSILKEERERLSIDCEKMMIEKEVRFAKGDVYGDLETAKRFFATSVLRGFCRSKDTEFSYKKESVYEEMWNKEAFTTTQHLCAVNFVKNKTIRCLFLDKDVLNHEQLIALREKEPELFEYYTF